MSLRASTIHRRLIRAFGLFVGVLLMVTWASGLAYFFWSEREDLRALVRTQASIVATQSSAAVVFDDAAALSENLAMLRPMSVLRWALIIQPPAGNGAAAATNRLAQYGSPPERIDDILVKLGSGDDAVIGWTELVVMRPIMHDGVARAVLLMSVDLTSMLLKFVAVIVISLLANLLVFGIGVVAFNRIVSRVSGPIQALVRVSEKVAVEGSQAVRATVAADDEIGQLARAINHMLDTLSAHESDLALSRDELRALSARLQDVREEERKRISHELHDELGQRLTAIKFELARLSDVDTRSRLGEMVDSTIKVVRTLSWDLRPTVLDSMGLVAAIEWMAQDFQQRMGIRCGVQLPAMSVVLNPDQATDVFRVCQELLTNITRHAKASRVDIRFVVTDDLIRLEVEDNGVGMPFGAVKRDSLGLLGIRERCQRWGGGIAISRDAQGGGSCVRATFQRSPALPVAETRS